MCIRPPPCPITLKPQCWGTSTTFSGLASNIVRRRGSHSGDDNYCKRIYDHGTRKVTWEICRPIPSSPVTHRARRRPSYRHPGARRQCQPPSTAGKYQAISKRYAIINLSGEPGLASTSTGSTHMQNSKHYSVRPRRRPRHLTFITSGYFTFRAALFGYFWLSGLVQRTEEGAGGLYWRR